MIERFYDKTATVSRQVKSGNTSSLTEQGTVDGHLQQANDTLVENLNLDFTTAFSFWCDEGSDIQRGDKVVIDGTSYSVSAIQDNSTGRNKHLQVVLERDEV